MSQISSKLLSGEGITTVVDRILFRPSETDELREHIWLLMKRLPLLDEKKRERVAYDEIMHYLNDLRGSLGIEKDNEVIQAILYNAKRIREQMDQEPAAWIRVLKGVGKFFKRVPVAIDTAKMEQGRIIVYFIRHGHAQNNRALEQYPETPFVLDPHLTPLGIEECHELQLSNILPVNPTLILCSPMTRTLQTATLALKPHTDKGLKIIAWPELREWSLPYGLCGTGSKLEKLVDEFGGENGVVDFTLVEEGWQFNGEGKNWKSRIERVKKGLWELGNMALSREGGTWKGMQIAGRGQSDETGHKVVEIVVVSHGGFLSSLHGWKRQSLYNCDVAISEFPPEKSVREEGLLPWELGAWVTEEKGKLAKENKKLKQKKKRKKRRLRL